MRTRNLRYAVSLMLTAGLAAAAHACEVCEAQQPKALRGVVHGAGPDNMDLIISAIGGVIVLFVLVMSIRLLYKPKEGDPKHIKYSVIDGY